jgi:hypothetical protein
MYISTWFYILCVADWISLGVLLMLIIRFRRRIAANRRLKWTTAGSVFVWLTLVSLTGYSFSQYVPHQAGAGIIDFCATLIAAQ